MAPLGSHSIPVLVTILLACFSCFLITAFSLVPTAPLHDASDTTDFQALLCLKLHLNDNAGVMASWRNDSSQYCQWPGVTCSKSHTSRVTELNLESSNLHGQIPPCIGNLTFLTIIHLPFNLLTGNIPPEIGHLRRLTYLNLTSNGLTGTIPEALSSCSNLQIIDLSNNSIDGEIPSSMNKCSNLQAICLFDNKLQGVIPEGLGTLSNLSVLYLSNNNLSGNIPFSLGSNSFLNVVILTNNSLTGGIPPLLANSSSLKLLDLTNNRLGGEIPFALFNSSSLNLISLAVNNFVGSIPPISNISSPLWYLSLSQNNLSGSIPSSIENLSSLEILYLSQNNFQGTIPSSLSRIPNLQELDLTYNNLSGTVPASLYNMSNLVYLGMGTNKLIGEIPDNIGYTLPNIKTLILQGNQFQGQIPTSLGIAKNLQVINLRDNAFHGIIPSFGNLPDLMELNLGMNRLEAGDWSFLSSLITSRQLVQLCLDKNILKGTLPSSIAKLSTSLQVLLLTGNEISGTIPQEIEKLTSLTLLYMEKNLLTGNLPDSLGNLPNLFILSLSQNKISGQIPPSIGNLSHLSELYLQENNLSGPIPSSLGSCKNLEALNLSCNSFDSSIPKELVTLSSLSEWLDLSHNQLDGEIPSEIGGSINLDILNISNNRLSGQIPSALGDCVHLSSLRMEGNLLDGRIPNSFINLRGIVELDLSQNNLSGKIPEFIESFGSMKLLNLSFNDFEGQVPTEGIFQNASEVFIQGNKKLCGTYPLLQLPLCNVKQSKGKHTNKILRIVGPIAICLALTSCLVFILLKKRNKVKQASDPSCKELKTFTYADIVKATNGFALANLVGSGKYGSVYKGRFEFEEQPVAIKVFKLDQVGAPKCFLAECEALRNTRHRNLVRVITACSTCDPRGHEFKALILEYMANGSLESWLYPKVNKYGLKKPLSLGYRIKIAVDIASALDYLHNYCIPPMVHCDLKPNNILLDDVMGARLGDFGLAKFLQSNSSSKFNSSTSLAGPRGSIGYIAPEYGYGSKVSVEGDVYSYGIIILEMLTGKTPTDQMFSNGLNIRKYVESTFFSHKIGEILDPNIIPNFEEDTENNCDPENHVMTGMLSCVMQLAKLGISCSMETPKDRPAMQDVYAEVIAIKEAFSALRV
ncbi:receptor kinase-like protein Xa21 [Oryza glaberrima]|uniref:receptor kinase-like protein Xa21 n=1 Tax=Oryza glaberrima TaxID=4538 RepID=UPI00224BFB99|nr:receptor kinase-like protein Xa21 [Oryza glaberrima]